MHEVYPGTRIPKSLWASNFKDFVLNPPKVYSAGIEGDRAFLKDAARAMFPDDVLLAHSIAGKKCNVNVKKAKDKDVDAEAEEVLPSLPQEKISAIASK